MTSATDCSKIFSLSAENSLTIGLRFQYNVIASKMAYTFRYLLFQNEPKWRIMVDIKTYNPYEGLRGEQINFSQFVDSRSFLPSQTPQFLTEEQVAQYNRDGFIHIPGMLDESLIHELRNEASKLLSDDYYYLKNPHSKLDLFSSPLIQDSIHESIADLNGPSSIFESFLFQKIPIKSRLKPWHQDGIYWGSSDQRIMAMFIPLTKMSLENGGLQFFAGSHLLGRLHHKETAFCDLECDISAFKNPVCIQTKPGDVIFCHSLVVHGSTHNQTSQNRILLGYHLHHQSTRIAKAKPTSVKISDTHV